jgi:BirA family biotin operon repressor/biotin-[acetyl-CoA-carboxylase] ligase
LKQITGHDFELITLARELCICLDKRYIELINSGFEPIYTQYIQQLYKLNEKVKFKKDKMVFEEFVIGVSPLGKLIVKHGMEEEFGFGEVEWMR